MYSKDKLNDINKMKWATVKFRETLFCDIERERENWLYNSIYRSIFMYFQQTFSLKLIIIYTSEYYNANIITMYHIINTECKR